MSRSVLDVLQDLGACEEAVNWLAWEPDHSPQRYVA